MTCEGHGEMEADELLWLQIKGETKETEAAADW